MLQNELTSQKNGLCCRQQLYIGYAMFHYKQGATGS